MRRYELRPLSGSPQVKPIVAFDVEGTGDVGGFLIGAIADRDGVRTFTDPGSMRLALLSYAYRDARIFAHNAAYDWGILFQDHIRDWRVYMLDGRFIKARYTDGAKHSWEIWDSANLSAFSSVAALGQVVGVDKLDPPDWILDRAMRPNLPADWTPNQAPGLAAYVARDAEIVRDYVVMLQDVIVSLGGRLCCTLSSTALDLWRRAYQDRSYRSPHPRLNQAIRAAYYGGRVEMFQFGRGDDLYQYDINSMYPAVMRDGGLPDPDALCYYEHTCSIDDVLEYEGVTCATVLAPEIPIPILPVRVAGRLLFTTGRFTGTWTHVELRLALENGYRIERIHWQAFSTTTVSPFSEYVDSIYALRQGARQAGNPIAFTYKILLNGLYGKFGQRSDGRLRQVCALDTIPDFVHKTGLDLREWCGRLYVDRELAGDRQPAYVNTAWAAYITAAGRVREWAMLNDHADGVVYCDTDSVVLPSEIETSAALGAWALERGPCTMEFRREKYYRIQQADGSWQYRIKGIPASAQADYWATGRASFPRPTKIRESMTRGTRISTWYECYKSEREQHRKRCILWDQADGSGLVPTRPWTYEEAVAHYDSAPPLLPWRSAGALPESIYDSIESGQIAAWRARLAAGRK